MRNYDIVEIEKIIKNFKETFENQIDSQMDFCLAQSSLKNVIEIAAKAIDETGKVHFHQRRISKTELADFADVLLRVEDKILTVSTFDGLYKIINGLRNKEISDLTVYDTALRIGNYLKIFPQKIYLQTGTRVGAEVLLGNLGDRKTLLKSDFPDPFQADELSLFDIENILYQYKRELRFCVLWD